MQARKISYDVIGLTKPLNATFNIGKELLFRTCDSKGVVESLVNNPDRPPAAEKIWMYDGLDNLRRLRPNIQF
ncbi:hypothetical protein ANCCAN_22651 [Ancylostoma caninum]|uniref:Uncharacterized protein n=1 Tax=Ancylostoma caninum TaxID=29170 RepID=A0A368FL69_ANCCA|nr:hypothetical protein ANCCAN_22651 [Ancylostoma caninum]